MFDRVRHWIFSFTNNDGPENTAVIALPNLRTRIQLLLLLFIVGLLLSGVTAMPLETELRLLASWIDGDGGVAQWLARVRDALIDTNAKYPFLAYGTDWLAFAHLVLAILFIGPLRDPVRNVWVVEFGMIACVLIVPFALVAGSVRGIPLGWRLIDSSFGIIGFIPLWFCRKWILQLAGRN